MNQLAIMCGLVAIYHYSGHRQVAVAELNAMRAWLAPRGPDGHGSWCSDEGAVGLGHQRLAIIGPGIAGAQPMHGPDRSVHLVFNGAIYNHGELRRELQADGVAFVGTSDTEVLLHLYLRDGLAMLHRLRGMFAFALYDGERRRLLLARDPYGIKPLYLAQSAGCVRAASQVQALLASPEVDSALEPAGLVGLLSFGSVPEPWTMHRGIRALPAGHYLVVDERGAAEPVAYAAVPDVLQHAEARPIAPLARAELLRRLRVALSESVRHHLIADVPVSVFLSSGIDSATLLALASELADQPPSSLTLAFEDFRASEQDEAALAALIARRYRSFHHIERVSRQALIDAAADWLGAMDQPTIDGLNSWLISRLAKSRGIKVALSGLGGDELFGGYPSFQRIGTLVKATAWARHLPAIGRRFQQLHRQLLTPLQLTSDKAAGLLRYGGEVAGAYLLQRGLFLPAELFDLLDEDVALAGLSAFSPVDAAERIAPSGSRPSFETICALESSLYLQNQLLRDTDWASMAHGVEVRAPLVDYTLLQQLAPLLRQLWSAGAKPLLAQSPLRALPRPIVARAKRGFEVPVAPWLEHPDLAFNTWRRVPSLARTGVHASRRLAYVVARHHAGPEAMARSAR